MDVRKVRQEDGRHWKAGRRWALTVVLGCVAPPAVLAPAALLVGTGGKISGTVTEAASPFKPLKNIEVTVYESRREGISGGGRDHQRKR